MRTRYCSPPTSTPSRQGLPRADFRRAGDDPNGRRSFWPRSRPSGQEYPRSAGRGHTSRQRQYSPAFGVRSAARTAICATRGRPSASFGWLGSLRILAPSLRPRYRLSERYAAALTGYASSVFVRKIKKLHSRNHSQPHRRTTVNRIRHQPHLYERGQRLILLRLLRGWTRARSGYVGRARGRYRRCASQSGRAHVGDARSISTRHGAWRYRCATGRCPPSSLTHHTTK